MWSHDGHMMITVTMTLVRCGHMWSHDDHGDHDKGNTNERPGQRLVGVNRVLEEMKE
jgi:hypothetical protein